MRLIFRGLIPIILLTLLGAGIFARAEERRPVRLEVEPLKRIYSNREGLMVQFTFTALERAKLCLEKDILSQMQMTINRSGRGKLPLQPLVIRDNRELFQDRIRVRWLEPGERMTVRANLKRFRFAEGEAWVPGEYSVGAVFHLCPQTPDETVDPAGQEIPIRSAGQGWFMIMI